MNEKTKEKMKNIAIINLEAALSSIKTNFFWAATDETITALSIIHQLKKSN